MWRRELESVSRAKSTSPFLFFDTIFFSARVLRASALTRITAVAGPFAERNCNDCSDPNPPRDLSFSPFECHDRPH